MGYSAVVALLLAVVLQTALSADVLWILDEPSDESSYVIKYKALPDGEVTTFDLDKTSLPDASHIAFDSTREVLYLASDQGYLARVPEAEPDGTTLLPTTGTSAAYGPRGVAVDEITGAVYYTDYEDSEIVAVWYNSTASTAASSVVQQEAGSLRDIAVDYNVGLMFWVDYDERRIRCSGMDGSGVGTVYTGESTDVSQLQGVGVDLDDSYVYWCDHNARTLSRAQYSATTGCSPSGGFTVQVIHTFPDDVSCRDVAVGQETLYYSQFDESQQERTSAVYSVPKSSLSAGGTIVDSDRTDLDFTTTFPASLALQRDNPPVIDTACTQPETCSTDQMCVVIPIGHRCVCIDGAENCQDSAPVARNNETDATTATAPGGDGEDNSAMALTLPYALVTLLAVIIVPTWA